jgi:[acyl-carrier-protein] S-malonyltransferase
MERIAFIFPGQGSQAVGMAQDLYEVSVLVREIYERASEAIQLDLAKLSFEGPEEDLRKTVNTQPALLVASVAAHTLIVERGIEPWAVAGHSLGEYSALVAARTLTLEDAVIAVRERGRLMYEAGLERPGTMAAIIGLSESDVEQIVREARADGIVQIANLNAPTQIVISGEVAAVKSAMDLAATRNARRVIPLNVSGAFHSDLLESARVGLGEALSRTAFAKPQSLFVSNVTGTAVEEPSEIRDGLALQIVRPVRWMECVRALVNRKASFFVEVGPGNVLRGLMRKIEPASRSVSAGKIGDIDKLPAAIAAG